MNLRYLAFNYKNHLFDNVENIFRVADFGFISKDVLDLKLTIKGKRTTHEKRFLTLLLKRLDDILEVSGEMVKFKRIN